MLLVFYYDCGYSVLDINRKIPITAITTPAVMKMPVKWLMSPVGGLMTGRIIESLDSSIHLRFYTLKNNLKELLFEGIGRNAGLEVVGNLDEIGAIEV